MEAVMNKVVTLLALTTFISGCKGLGEPQLQSRPAKNQLPDARCVSFYKQQSISARQVDEIRYLSTQYVNCAVVLGLMYEHGHGVPQDFAKARAVYESMVDREPGVYSRLGAMAENGVGGPVDLVAARDFYQRSVINPGHADAEFKVAEFLEFGKGGPQDLQGALKYYLSSGNGVDDALSALQRLRARGVTMTTAQQARYNEIFESDVRYRLRNKAQAMEETLKKERMTARDSQPVTVQLEGIPGMPVPTITLVQSSGNSTVDQKVLQGYADYRFPAEPILPPEQKTYWIRSTVMTDGKTDLQRMAELISK